MGEAVFLMTRFISLIRPNMTGGMNYHTTAKSIQALTYGDTSADQRNPRVILISSRVPAAEVNILHKLDFEQKKLGDN